MSRTTPSDVSSDPVAAAYFEGKEAERRRVADLVLKEFARWRYADPPMTDGEDLGRFDWISMGAMGAASNLLAGVYELTPEPKERDHAG
jgi:hypothetical protein